MTRQIILELDELDYDTVQGYIADFQANSSRIHAMSGVKSGEAILPDGESNMVGGIIAECVRDLLEYREIWDAEHGKETP